MSLERVLDVFKPDPNDPKRFLWVGIFYNRQGSGHPDENFTVIPGHDANFLPIAEYSQLAEVLAESGQTNLLGAIDQAFVMDETYRRATGRPARTKKLTKAQLAEKLARWGGEY